MPSKRFLKKHFLLFFTFTLSSIGCGSEYWTPDLHFDIEGKGFTSSMIFISGQSYSLSSSNKIILMEGKVNFYCSELEISSKILIEILNSDLSGIVSAEKVTESINRGLMKKYPCTLMK